VLPHAQVAAGGALGLVAAVTCAYLCAAAVAVSLPSPILLLGDRPAELRSGLSCAVAFVPTVVELWWTSTLPESDPRAAKWRVIVRPFVTIFMVNAIVLVAQMFMIVSAAMASETAHDRRAGSTRGAAPRELPSGG
jgi:hypothetical protein